MIVPNALAIFSIIYGGIPYGSLLVEEREAIVVVMAKMALGRPILKNLDHRDVDYLLISLCFS